MRRRRLVEVAFGFLACGLALQAQHGGPAGGMPSPHFGAAPNFGAAPHLGAAPPSFAPPSRSVSASPAIHSPSSGTGRPGHLPAANPPHRPNNGRGNGGVDNRGRYPSVYAGYPWLFPFGYGLPFGDGFASGGNQDEASGAQQPTTPESAGQPPIDYVQQTEVAANAPSPFRPAYQGQTAIAPVHDQPATILIFKDGRPSAQVHNYALTASTLYAFDGESRQEISLSLLNVPATVAANRAAGVDFALPVNR